MKQAQQDNPLSCRGFRKPVILTISSDGFRLDMVTDAEEGSLFSANARKVVMAQAVDRSVYVVVHRGSGKGGKYSCHCLAKGLKRKERAEAIATFVNDSVVARSPSASPTTQRRTSLVEDDGAAAQLRVRMGVLEGDAAPAASGGDGYIETELSVVGPASGGAARDSGRLRDYVADSAGEGADLTLDEIKMLRENDDDAQYDVGGVGTASYDSFPWFKGTMERVVVRGSPGSPLLRPPLSASRRRGCWPMPPRAPSSCASPSGAGQASPGGADSRRSRVSLTKVGYCLTLRTASAGVRHFLTETRAAGRLGLQGAPPLPAPNPRFCRPTPARSPERFHRSHKPFGTLLCAPNHRRWRPVRSAPLDLHLLCDWLRKHDAAVAVGCRGVLTLRRLLRNDRQRRRSHMRGHGAVGDRCQHRRILGCGEGGVQRRGPRPPSALSAMNCPGDRERREGRGFGRRPAPTVLQVDGQPLFCGDAHAEVGVEGLGRPRVRPPEHTARRGAQDAPPTGS